MRRTEARFEACSECGFIFDEEYFPQHINDVNCPVCHSEGARSTHWTGRLIIINHRKSRAWELLKEYRNIEEDSEGMFAVELE
ncbi:MAG TPA: hypothetical protein ENK81_03830 [Euryarchaeota archaeon]|nr:hypothetical protein [Euryarchaeota archaeon]